MLTIEQKAERAKARKEERLEAKKAARIAAEKTGKRVRSVNIDVSWVTSRTWGANPHASAFFVFEDGTTARAESKTSGCGYDKLSQVVSDVLNEAMKRDLHDAAVRYQETTEYLRPYGAAFSGDYVGFAGAVGISAIQSVVEFLGFRFIHRAGKMWDCIIIEKKAEAQS